MLASLHDHLKIVKLLIENNADVNHRAEVFIFNFFFYILKIVNGF
jgi:hypothetical protein